MSLVNLKNMPITILLTTFAVISVGLGSHSFQNSFAHNFSPDESAHFLTIVEKIKVESALAENTTDGNSDQSSGQIHANIALQNYDSHTKDELSERNERIATELDDTLNTLLIQIKSPDKSQLVNTVETIDAILEEAISTRIDQEQLNNSTIQALILASIVDTALQNYGDAFNVGIDLTNMSNIHKLATTADTVSQSGLLNFSNYESASAFSNKALDKYYKEISPSSLAGNNTKTQDYLKKLENGLLELDNAINNKEKPMNVMKIVHTNIHPNLQILFNLKSS
ncbi:MAG TPA: hypothetical protein VK250_10365 [Nitrososphaeraceae archaeon]|nr:hypothetical protein [Nitrososphaeraceae archaeon]